MAKRREPPETAYQYSQDYPIDPPGAVSYALVGIEPELMEKFKEQCRADRRSLRWTLLSLMHAYVRGEVKL